MNQIIIESSIQSKKVGNSIKIFISRSMNAVAYAIMTTKMTNNALQVSIIENPSFTISIQKISKWGIRRSSKRVKVFAIDRVLHIQNDPMLPRFVMRVGITHE